MMPQTSVLRVAVGRDHVAVEVDIGYAGGFSREYPMVPLTLVSVG